MERRPDPEPLETNDVALVTGGTVLWAVGLVVLLVAKAAGAEVRAWWWQTCLAGALLGLAGIRYCRNRRDRLTAD